MFGGGGGIQIPMGGRGGFSFTTMLIIGALMLLFGLNPLDLLTGGGGIDMSRVPQMPQMDGGQPGTAARPDIPGLPGSQGRARARTSSAASRGACSPTPRTSGSRCSSRPASATRSRRW